MVPLIGIWLTSEFPTNDWLCVQTQSIVLSVLQIPFSVVIESIEMSFESSWNIVVVFKSALIYETIVDQAFRPVIHINFFIVSR